VPLPIDVYLATLRREGDALAAAASTTGLDARVPACPDWNVADLVWHAGEVFHFWAWVARELPADPGAGYPAPTRPDGGELIAWYRGELDDLEETLRSADPTTPCWTWAGPQPIAWLVRRMAQETAVHRWDAEAAAGTPAPVDAALAVDGVDEFLEFFRGDTPALAGTVHLHATDIDGEWLVSLAAGTMTVERGHAKGDAAIRGPASDLLLLLWRRTPLSRLEVFGDATLAERFVAEPDLD
jgi:uncharacterized protein (TIGR03083 family)